MDCYRAAETIKGIAQRYGAGIIWDAAKMKSLFRDFAPELAEESKLIAMVYDSGIHNMLMNASGDVSGRMNQLGAFKRQLINTLYISETAADDVMTIFALALGWEASIPSEPRRRGTRPDSGQIPYTPPVYTPPITPVTQQKKSKAPIITAAVIAFIGVAAAIFAVCIIYFGPGKKDDSTDKPVQSPEPTKLAEQTEPPDIYTEAPYKTDPPATVMPRVTDEPEPDDDYLVDYDFSYSYNRRIDQNPTYTRMYNNRYSYYCDIPDNFTRADYTNERRSYYADDGSAIILLCAENNSGGKSLDRVKNEYIAKIGGTLNMDLHGSDWFALSIDKSGTSYYIKCYVDEYIRSYEMIFPEEYLDYYSPYIEYMEDNYKRTD